jgi:integrase
MMGTCLEDSDLVFSHADGNPFLSDTVSRAWEKLTKKTGLKDIRLHDARHTQPR